MSNVVDERVVEMMFDNRDFEKGIEQTISSLDDFKKKLNLDGATKGFDNVEKAANRMDLGAPTKAVEQIQIKFSAMQVVALTAIQNITNSMMAAGKQYATMFTTTPIKTGFQEYETQINAVQTILANTASKGTTLDDVNLALDTLNTYADKTIYNFTEMTRNIGTFTAAGTDLETSVTAIQGIANLAAVSGSTSQQAATAMYQLSQALSSGTVKLMDWNSVVNAGMGGQVFQDALKDTARKHNINIDSMIESQGSFRETLSKGWLTAEVLTDTLEKFTTGGVNEYLAKNSTLTADAIAQIRTEAKTYDEAADAIARKTKLDKKEIKSLIELSTTAEDAATKVKTQTQLMDTLQEAVQSGWTQTWEIIIGDFEEAKALFTEISDSIGEVIGDFSDQRNDLLEAAFGKKMEVTMEDWIEMITGGADSNELRKALLETGAIYDESLKDISSGTTEFMNSLTTGWLTTDILNETLSKFNIAIGDTSKDLSEQLTEYKKIADEVMAGDWGDGNKQKKAIEEAGYDYEIMSKIVESSMQGLAFGLEDFSEAQLASAGYTEDQIEALQEMASAATEAGNPLKSLMDELNEASGRELALEGIKNILSAIGELISPIGEAYREIFPSMTSDELTGVIERFHEFTEGLEVSEETLDKIKRTATGFFSIFKLIGRVIGTVANSALSIFNALTGTTNKSILDLTAGVGDNLTKFEQWEASTEKITGFIEGLTSGIVWLIDEVKNFVTGLEGGEKSLTTFKDLIGIFADAVSDAGDSADEGGNPITTFLTSFKAKVDEIGLGNILKLAGVITLVALGIKKLVNVIQGIKEGPMDKIRNIFDGIGSSLKGLALNVKSKAIKNIAISIGILVASVFLLSLIPEKKAWNSVLLLLAISGVLAAVSITLLKVVKDTSMKDVLSMVILMGAVVLAIGALALSLKMIAGMEGDVWRALAVIEIMMVTIGGLLIAINKFGGSVKGSAATVLAIGITIRILASAMKVLAEIPDGNFGKVLGYMLTAVGSMVAIMFVASKAPTGIKGMLSLLAIALSLKMVIGALAGLAAGDIEGIKAASIAMVTIGAMMTVLMAVSNIVSMKGVLAMGLITLIVWGLAEIILKLASSQPDQVIGVAEAMGNLLLKLSAACVVLALVGATGPAALIGMGVLSAIIIAFGGLLAAVGALITEFPGLQTLIDTGLPLLESLASGLGSVVGNFVGGIAEGITDRLPAMADNLSTFMENLQPFIDGAKQITPDMIQGVLGIAAVIVALTAADIIDGLTSWLTGGSSIQGFADDLAVLGPALETYANAVSNISAEDMKKVVQSANAAKALGEMAGALPNEGGVAGFFAGENDMSKFGEQLGAFGLALCTYAANVSTLDVAAINASIPAAQGLSDIMNSLPNEGGVAGFFAGENDMTTFASQLGAFGTGVSDYASAVSGMDVQSILDSIPAAQALSDIANALPNDGGVAGFFAGENDIATFGDQLVLFGTALSDYVAVAPTGSYPNLTPVKELVDLFVSMEGIDKGDAKQFRKSLDEIADMDLSQLDGVDVGLDAAIAIVDNFINGIASKNSDVVTAAQTLTGSVVTAISNQYGSFHTVGGNTAAGFAKGISDQSYQAVIAAINMARAARVAMEQTLEIHSPSRVTAAIGAYFGEGFVNAVHKMEADAGQAGKGLGDSAKTGLDKVVSDMTTNLNTEIGKNSPVITPILDTSKVSAGFRGISNMMNRSQAIGISASRAEAEGRTKVQNESKSVGIGTNIYFTQTNTSPKALRSIDIYRDTESALAKIKRKAGQQ